MSQGDFSKHTHIHTYKPAYIHTYMQLHETASKGGVFPNFGRLDESGGLIRFEVCLTLPQGMFFLIFFLEKNLNTVTCPTLPQGKCFKIFFLDKTLNIVPCATLPQGIFVQRLLFRNKSEYYPLPYPSPGIIFSKLSF